MFISGEKLPWSVKLDKCSVYSIHKGSSLHYLMAPVSLSTTVAVTTKYQPATSDNISSLGLVIHADMDTMSLGLSQHQVGYDMDTVSLGLSQHQVGYDMDTVSLGLSQHQVGYDMDTVSLGLSQH